MLVALCFGVTAIALLLLAPVALTTGQWQVRRPKLALAGWFGSFFIGALCAGAMVVSLVVAAVTTTASTSLTKAVATAVFSWLALAVAGAIIALVFAFTEPLNASQRATLRKMAPTAVSREKRDEFTFVRFEVAEPFACAVPGRLPQILVSTGLEDLLSAPQLQAVLAHEYAHLRHRHGWVVRIAELNALCLPRFFSAGHRLKQATLLLVELAADDTAAKQAGAVNLANALWHMSQETGDAGMLLRAQRLTLRRWPLAARCQVPDAIRI